MNLPKIERPLRLLERGWPWLLAGILATVLLFLLVAAVASGLLLQLDPRPDLRGYTTVGLGLGVLAVVFAILTFVYSYRKRAGQERMPLRGTMMVWLQSHVYFGILALLASMAHGGYGVISDTSTITTGKLLFYIFALLVLSGIAWRLVYRVVPRVAQPQIMNYSQEDAAHRATDRLVEIEKQAAGGSEELIAFKDLLIERGLGKTALDKAIADLPEKERGKAREIARLADSRHRALKRQKRQALYHRFLHLWRGMHVPLAGLFVVVLVLHIVAVFDFPAKAAPVLFGGFRPSEDCAACHTQIYEQWKDSMHAHALDSPVTIAQTNQDLRETLVGQPSPDPLLICQNCHAPSNTKLTQQTFLPFEAPVGLGLDDDYINEGVNCTTCHQYAGEPDTGIGGLAAVFQADLVPGRVYFGPYDDAVGNAYHQSKFLPRYNQPQTLCESCHNVNYDLNDDGVIEKGVDLVLQTTFEEFEDYVADGGTETCVSCHMPLMRGETRIAEGADIPTEQDREAPPRQMHDHSFVGVDYPLDLVSESDPQREAREELLRSAARINVFTGESVLEEGGITFEVGITNNDLGHNLPTGFAFARQMWFEVIVSDENGRTLFSSGVLRSNISDLCDAGTMDDPGNPLTRFVRDCAASDPQLVNFQQKLVDEIDILLDENDRPVRNDDGEFIIIQPPGSEETNLQHLTGGAVARVRPFDGQALALVPPNETRTFTYFVAIDGEAPAEIRISVRLLFRNLPPYFLRALAAEQPEDEVPQIEPLIENLQIVEMAAEGAVITFE